MTSLRKLSLVDVSIADISPLLSLPKLREVSLLRVPARADAISALQRNGVKVTKLSRPLASYSRSQNGEFEGQTERSE